jgi:hypothetical protein
VETVRSFTKGNGVHVVYDSVGKTTYEGSLNVLRPFGMLVLFGQSSGPVPPIDPLLLHQKVFSFLLGQALLIMSRTPPPSTTVPQKCSCPLPDIGEKRCRSGPRSRPKLTRRQFLVLLRCHPQRQSEPRVCPPGVAARQKGPRIDAPPPLDQKNLDGHRLRTLALRWRLPRRAPPLVLQPESLRMQTILDPLILRQMAMDTDP